MPSLRIHQIYYDDASRALLDPGFIALDNTANEVPEWHEFWPIRNFLRAGVLGEHSWYGFLSPKFRNKTGLTAWDVEQLVDTAVDGGADTLLLSPAWAQIAYFKNEFEQGERWHPGLLDACRRFLDFAAIDLDLDALVTHSCSAVYSNYVVARRGYWQDWLTLAEQLMAFSGTAAGAESLGRPVAYYDRQVPMGTFVQERLPGIIMARGSHRVASYFPSDTRPIGRTFLNSEPVRKLLQICDSSKRSYTQTGDEMYLRQYWEARRTIPRPSMPWEPTLKT